MSPGGLPRRHGKKTCGRQPECSSPPDGFGCRASRWQVPTQIGATVRGARFALLGLGCAAALVTNLLAAEPAAVRKATNSVATARAPAGGGTNAAPRFDVKAFVVKCDRLIFTNTPTSMLSEFTGTNVGLERIVRAASTVLSEFQRNGYARANISIAQEMITNGIVTMHVYQGAFPQVLISGRPFLAGYGA